MTDKTGFKLVHEETATYKKLQDILPYKIVHFTEMFSSMEDKDLLFEVADTDLSTSKFVDKDEADKIFTNTLERIKTYYETPLGPSSRYSGIPFPRILQYIALMITEHGDKHGMKYRVTILDNTGDLWKVDKEKKGDVHVPISEIEKFIKVKN